MQTLYFQKSKFQNFFSKSFLSSGVKHDVRYIGACQGNIMQLSRPFQLLAFSRKSHPYANAIFSKIKISKFFLSLFELRRKTRCALYRGMLGEYYAVIQTFQLLAFSRKSHPYANALFSKNKILKFFLSLFELRRKTRCALYRGMLGEYYAVIQTFLASRAFSNAIFSKIASLCVKTMCVIQGHVIIQLKASRVFKKNYAKYFFF